MIFKPYFSKILEHTHTHSCFLKSTFDLLNQDSLQRGKGTRKSDLLCAELRRWGSRDGCLMPWINLASVRRRGGSAEGAPAPWGCPQMTPRGGQGCGAVNTRCPSSRCVCTLSLLPPGLWEETGGKGGAPANVLLEQPYEFQLSRLQPQHQCQQSFVFLLAINMSPNSILKLLS